MKTTKTLAHLLVASALAVGTACSTTNTGTTSAGTTSGSTSPDASGAASGSGTMGTDASTGTTAAGGGTSGMSASASAAATDQAAFMGTFATMQDPVFLMTAASSNLLEIQLGQAATQRAMNADVKKFGQMMVDHHTRATQEMKTVATPLGVTLPQAMMPVHQAMADMVLAKSGKDFDESYMDAMETAHKLDIAMFEVKSGKAETSAVKAFATKTLPMLRSHHTMASELEKKVD